MEAGGLSLWVHIRQGFGSGAHTLMPQGMYAKIDGSSFDSDAWVVGEFYYNGVMYDNERAFRAALKSPEFVATPPNLDSPWTDTEDFDAAPPGRELPPPAMIQPYGPRNELDREEIFVSWFGFELFITTSAALGVSIYDIRFQGKRVIYELGHQEVTAHYAGDDPLQGSLEFVDTFFDMVKH